ncbi:MAG: twin-arginine translocase TatA/TatE family subunit [Bacteroidetes bacterium]|nr:twin-arginine translocase TatA/TatE family subunit [Bacteroidota bacterium]
MFGLSGGEIILILVVFLILFGSKKIPEFAQSLGKGMREFKKAASDIQTEIETETPQKKQPPVQPVQRENETKTESKA